MFLDTWDLDWDSIKNEYDSITRDDFLRKNYDI